MIKKVFKHLLTIFIVGLGIINFSSAFNGLKPIGSSYYFDGYESTILPGGQFETTYNGETKNMFLVNTNGFKYYFYTKNSSGFVLPYVIWNAQGFYNRIYTCSELIEGGSVSCNGSFNPIEEPNTLISFLSSVSSGDYFYYNGSSYYPGIYISSHSLGYSIFFEWGSSYLIDSLGISNFSFSNVPENLLYNSPGLSSGGGDGTGSDSELGEGGIELQSNESAINYFETQYGRDESICYVGVDNVTDLWGSSVSFQEGTGLSIFQAFSGLYGNFDLNKVYVWINNRLINYEQWFYRDSPLYLSNYNSLTNQVDLYYTGLNFPFANNPVAVYFMADNIESKSLYSTMGSQVVSYCNIKINSGTFEQIIDEADKNNINNSTEQSNTNIGLNPDGTEKNNNSGIGSGKSSFTGNFGSGTDITWDELQYSGDIQLTGFFDMALSEMKSALDNFQNPFTGILPQYIISALLFVALFKLLRK